MSISSIKSVTNQPTKTYIPAPTRLRSSSFHTLESKLLEFSKERPTSDRSRDDVESEASNFKMNMQIAPIAAEFENTVFTVKLVKSSRLKWALVWSADLAPSGHISILSVAKVAKTEELIFSIKFRGSTDLEELKFKCET